MAPCDMMKNNKLIINENLFSGDTEILGGTSSYIDSYSFVRRQGVYDVLIRQSHTDAWICQIQLL